MAPKRGWLLHLEWSCSALVILVILSGLCDDLLSMPTLPAANSSSKHLCGILSDGSRTRLCVADQSSAGLSQNLVCQLVLIRACSAAA
jgi:hypothetical protein